MIQIVRVVRMKKIKNIFNSVPMVTEACREHEFHCDGMCLSQALVCNGYINCPDSRADENNCEVEGKISTCRLLICLKRLKVECT